jgi:hypothetical protein
MLTTLILQVVMIFKPRCWPVIKNQKPNAAEHENAESCESQDHVSD